LGNKINDDEMDSDAVCIEEMHTKYGLENVDGRDHLGDLRVDGRYRNINGMRVRSEFD
jgi:hypothetical protein